MKFHMHKYRFDCLNNYGHNHMLHGYTGNMLGVESLHFHFYYGVSSYRNHTHYFFGVTGIPVKTENGHIHRMDGILESNGMHEHKFNGYTFENISYIPTQQAIMRVQ